jgi:nitrogen fixation NifU-like protein
MEAEMSERERLAKELQQQLLEQAGLRYSETVIEHWFWPRNFQPMTTPDGYARITGPCGDTMEIFLRVRDGVIMDASFATDGCSTTIASASMVVTLAIDRSVLQARAIRQEEILESLGGLPEESEHCALLAANTLHAAIDDYLATKNAPWKRLFRRS